MSLRLGPWVLAGLALTTALAAYVVRLPCRLVSWAEPENFRRLCYSDLPTLYASRGMSEGRFPYLDPTALLEYPVLQTVVASATGVLAHGLAGGAPLHVAQGIYFDLNAVLLAAVWVGVVLTTARLAARPAPAVLLALAPAVAVTAFINWDLWPVLCTLLALLAFRRARWVLGGVALGIGAAFKLFPFFVLGAVVVLALRRREAGPALRTAAGTVGAWAAVNLPAALADPQQWSWFWRFSGDRGAGFSSVWHWFNEVAAPRLGVPLLSAEGITVLALGGFAAGCALVLVLGLRAHAEPSLEQLAFLVLAAFVLTNKVYSPQFLLWLVPLLVLARPRVGSSWSGSWSRSSTGPRSSPGWGTWSWRRRGWGPPRTSTSPPSCCTRWCWAGSCCRSPATSCTGAGRAPRPLRRRRSRMPVGGGPFPRSRRDRTGRRPTTGRSRTTHRPAGQRRGAPATRPGTTSGPRRGPPAGAAREHRRARRDPRAADRREPVDGAHGAPAAPALPGAGLGRRRAPARVVRAGDRPGRAGR
ncbi:glycosyltransferase family 87 protein [Kocuria flava]|uniref:glycosyltransferase family 87 protein n=1 Tax=Kocuria flava TaxID=446860 RepID=UPI000C7BEC81|nr:glycosyltransferase 87 family protein [Kocuria flava]